jgi:hypothetical protein
MPFFHDSDRGGLRRRYREAWWRHRERLPLEPLDAMIADVVQLHPEYHALLEADDEAIERDWSPEQGTTNPFLHMGLHMAIREQVSTDRPAGIRAAHATLAARLADVHAAEHQMLERLAEALWRAQRDGQPPDEQAYLESIRALTGGSGRRS